MSTEPAPADATQSIVVDYDLPHTPEKVWRALTEPALLGAWLMPNDIRPQVGHRFTFTTQPVGGWDGIVHCEVLSVEPLRCLRYSWQGGEPDSQLRPTLNTVVTWTLEPAPGGGTHLRLEQSGFTPLNAMAFQVMGSGWRTHVAQRMEAALAEVA